MGLRRGGGVEVVALKREGGRGGRQTLSMTEEKPAVNTLSLKLYALCELYVLLVLPRSA